jgi:hypothetical protein
MALERRNITSRKRKSLLKGHTLGDFL